MSSETKICQNCKKDFVIEPEDFKFYEKIKVPPPTWCPECRMVRRFTVRNERSLYKREESLHNREVISMYSSDKPFIVYHHNDWWSDGWNPMQYGFNYDFSKTFFEQFRKLLELVPALALSNVNPVNSEYCNFADGNKNCYLCFGAGFNEGVSYSTRVGKSKDSMDLLGCVENELCYDNVSCSTCYQLFYGMNCKNCVSSYFLYNCKNCTDCVGCVNLINKSNYIFNKPYTKEDYQKKIKELNLDSREGLSKVRKEFENILSTAVRRYGDFINSPKSTGDHIFNSKNCRLCFDILGNAEDCANLFHSYNLKDSYDGMGLYKTELSYENVDTNFNARLLSSVTVYHCNNVSYSSNCHSSNNLFACIGLRSKSYCILNKQYTKEEYEKLVPRIIEHMNQMPYIDQKGRVYKYGEFFPPELSPFAYNETIVQEYFPLTKEEAIEKGYSWKDPEPRNYKIQIPNDKLPDHIKDVKDDIVGQVIECGHKGKCNEQCTEAFKIIQPELDFLRKMSLPLPRLCPNCRHYQRIKQRNPLKLWKRKCQCAGAKSDNQIYANTVDHIHHKKEEHCLNEFETTYAPERPEIVYCEACYLREVV
ncbi:MAG: hypothetical protein Q8R12_03140 [bacterium]|nr:hypothetical protein [bacterium]